MPTYRRKDILRSRRRVEDEGEDDISVTTELAEDSQSEQSLPSDIEEDSDADADDSDASGGIGKVDPTPSSEITKSSTNGFPIAVKGPEEMIPTTIVPKSQNSTDHEETVKVLELSREPESSRTETHMIAETKLLPSNKKMESLSERWRRDQEEYKQKWDSDPAFVPNRGSFFMHDNRSTAPGSNGFRPHGKGRDRDKNKAGAAPPYSSTNGAKSGKLISSTWQHDLHDTVAGPDPKTYPQTSNPVNRSGLSKSTSTLVKPGPIRSFSTTRHLGNLQISIWITGMKAPIIFPDVPVKEYTRLPNHRPPLRRDKPVRIFIAGSTARHAFPSNERSFIFIPRALRPNQQGFGRGRGRGSLGRYVGFSSRRTSAYGESAYSPSVEMSRRSSITRDVTRECLASPAGSVMLRPAGAPMDGLKPIVRLPPGQHHTATTTPIQSISNPPNGTALVNLPSSQTYPLPQKPAFRENWPSQIVMHQPRPQKAIAVSGMESPVISTFHAPQPQEQQPFHHQVPHMNGQCAVASADPSVFSYSHTYPHTRQLSYSSQASGGTPLSNIPERAVHAQPFEPFQQQAPSMAYPSQSYPAQSAYFYPGVPSNCSQPPLPPQQFVPSAASPNAVQSFIYVPQNSQQYSHPGYILPTPTVSTCATPMATGHGNTMAQEANGMVYYYDQPQVPEVPNGPDTVGTTPTAYVDVGAGHGYTVPGMSEILMSSPEGYYYPRANVFYNPGTVGAPMVGGHV